MTENRFALIIANDLYKYLSPLKTPPNDAEELANVLKDPETTNFKVDDILINERLGTLYKKIGGFFKKRKRDDFLLLYFAGHGLKDIKGKLFLGLKETDLNNLSGTAIPANFITEEMDTSNSQRIVLILDCCMSGAVSKGMRGAGLGASMGTKGEFEGNGMGRYVLTATDSTQYAWENDHIFSDLETSTSVFTHHLIKGLQGEAANKKGEVTIDGLYTYVFNQVQKTMPKQTPEKFTYKEKGTLVIAHKVYSSIQKGELPPGIIQALEIPDSYVRKGVVDRLADMLQGRDKSMALAAYDYLMKLKEEDDSRKVSAAADDALKNCPEEIQKIIEIPKEKTDNLIDLLKEGKIDEFNRNRSKMAKEKIDLTSANLTGANIAGVDFSGLNLSETNLTGANLTGANLTGLDFTKVGNLMGANLSDADLTGANLSGLDLLEVKLTGTNLTNAKLSGLDFTKIKDLKGATFSKADLKGASLSGLDLLDVELTGTNLTDAKLSGLDFTKIKDKDLKGAIFSKADLTGANLSGLDLLEVKLTGTNLTDAKLSGLDFTKVKDLRRTNFRGADLSDADLRVADLSKAILIGANLKGANLRGADLIGAKLSDADLSDADLIGAKLSDADLSKAILIGAKLIDARLIGAKLIGAKLIGANLSDAYLNVANLRGANLSETIFSGAKFDDICLNTILRSENWKDAKFDPEVRDKLKEFGGSRL